MIMIHDEREVVVIMIDEMAMISTFIDDLQM